MFGPRARIGPWPSLISPAVLVVGIGIVAGKADLDGDADVGLDPVGAGRAAAQTDLLLDRADADHGRPAVTAPADFAQHLGDHEGTDLVVEGPRGDPGPLQPFNADGEGHRIADRHQAWAAALSTQPMSMNWFLNGITLSRSFVSR